jgi:hypothetical protein
VPERSVKHFVVQTRCSKLFVHKGDRYVNDYVAARLKIWALEIADTVHSFQVDGLPQSVLLAPVTVLELF